MSTQETYIDGLMVIKPMIFEDARGYFFESFSAKKYDDIGIIGPFVQDNESLSQKGVMRGLHYQVGDAAQAKLVRVVRGSVYDIAVDIREGSPTYGRSYGLVLSAENKMQLYVPRGFAHGFLVLEDDSIFSYKCDNYYDQSAERGILYDDPQLDIQWPDLGMDFIISEKDRIHPSFGQHDPSEVNYG